jgi:hypothetical protein
MHMQIIEKQLVGEKRGERKKKTKKQNITTQIRD